jgi:signal transduction histidine kinase
MQDELIPCQNFKQTVRGILPMRKALQAIGFLVGLIGLTGLLGHFLNNHLLKSLSATTPQEISPIIAVVFIHIGLAIARLPLPEAGRKNENTRTNALETRAEGGGEQAPKAGRFNRFLALYLAGLPLVVGAYYVIQYLLISDFNLYNLLTEDYPYQVAFLSAVKLVLIASALLRLGRKPPWKPQRFGVELTAFFVLAVSIFSLAGQVFHAPVLFSFDQPFADIFAFILASFALLLASANDGGLLCPLFSEYKHNRHLALLGLGLSLGIMLEGLGIIRKLQDLTLTQSSTVLNDLAVRFEYSSVFLATGIAVLILRAIFHFTRAQHSEEALREINETLERRVTERTAELENAYRELEAFSYTVSHDLRAPTRIIGQFAHQLADSTDAALTAENRELLTRIQLRCSQMQQLIEDLLDLSRIQRYVPTLEPVDLSQMVRNIVKELREQEPNRQVELRIQPDVMVVSDSHLLGIILSNLMGNAWKYTSKREHAIIEFGTLEENSEPRYFIRDNGAGFDMVAAQRLFQPFERLHAQSEFQGIGIGLATVQRAILRCGGAIYAEGTIDQGATFIFSVPAASVTEASTNHQAETSPCLSRKAEGAPSYPLDTPAR